MNTQSGDSDLAAPQPGEVDVVGLIKEIQGQLFLLNKKVDILINQSNEQPKREERFSKPDRPFNRPYRPGKGYEGKERDRSSKGKGFYSGQPFEKRRGGEGRKFGGPKREYGAGREGGGEQGRPFKKKYDGKKGSGPRGKPAYSTSKKRDR